jgi:DNA-nicking Smr family endonuclease
LIPIANLLFEESGMENTDEQDPITLEIDGVLDLHTFNPKELKPLLDDYFSECVKRKIYDIRIIHGKGKGILRDRVLAILKKHPMVQSYSQAPLEAGGWGAVVVELNRS